MLLAAVSSAAAPRVVRRLRRWRVARRLRRRSITRWSRCWSAGRWCRCVGAFAAARAVITHFRSVAYALKDVRLRLYSWRSRTGNDARFQPADSGRRRTRVAGRRARTRLRASTADNGLRAAAMFFDLRPTAGIAAHIRATALHTLPLS